METTQKIRVVLVSPSDVQAERDATEPAVAEVNQLLRDGSFAFELELRRWETDAYPGMHPQGPQGLIDAHLKIEESDVVLGIFWNRLGTPVSSGARSGTEHEIRRAIDAWRAKGRPQIMLYFRKPAYELTSEADIDQQRTLLEFKDELLATEKPLVWHYTEVQEYHLLIKRHLWKHVMGIVNAEVVKASPLRVSVFTDPVHVRQEGTTELVGDIFLECTYVAPAPPERPLWFSVMISFATVVTSRFMTNAFGTSTSDVVLFEVGRPGAFLFRRSRSIEGANSLMFNVDLDDVRPNEKRVFRISNIRCNANFLPESQILADIRVGSVEIPIQVLATTGRGFEFEIMNPDGAPWVGFEARQSVTLAPQRIASLRFTEGFPNAFKTRAPMSESIWNKWAVGKVYNSESCILGPALQMPDGRVNCTGLADYGTRLQARFNNIPDGVRLYVSTTEVPISGWATMRASIVQCESTISDTSEVIDGFKVSELRIQGGSAVTVWEVNSPPHRGFQPRDQWVFAVFASWEAAPQRNRPALGTALVTGSLAPVPPRFSPRDGFFASATLPIPRFVDTSRAINLMRVIP